MGNNNHCECPRWSTCKYGEILWWTEGVPNKCCGYILQTEQPRGCDIENCDKYEPRNKPRAN